MSPVVYYKFLEVYAVIGNDSESAMLQRALDGTWQRQKAISNNIANIETPGYKAQKVTFEAALAKEMKNYSQYSGSEKEQGVQNILDSNITLNSDSSTSERLDGNNVNIDSENIELAKTQIQYQYLVRSMTDMYSRLRYAVTEGRK